MIDENVKKKLLDLLQKGERQACLMEESTWPVLYHLSDIRENLLEWYPFQPEASLLEIGAECGALTALFCRKVSRVVAIEPSAPDACVNRERNRHFDNLTICNEDFLTVRLSEKFDYVTLIGGLGYAGQYKDADGDVYMKMLAKAKACLKPGGKMFLAIENKYGMKYFAGAVEEHTGRCFDGLENYAATSDFRTFSHKTLQKMLLKAGFSLNHFYYPLPDYKLPSEIYSDENLPSFGSVRYPSVSYDYDRYELIDERLAFDGICQDGMFDEFANSFLVISECGQSPSPEETVVYAKYNRQRAPEFQISTKIIVRENGQRYVEKKALCPEATAHVERLAANRRKLLEENSLLETKQEGGGAPVPVELLLSEEGRAVFAFENGKSLANEVHRSLGDSQMFLQAMHCAVDSIYGAFFKSEKALVDFKVTDAFEKVFGLLDAEQISEVSAGMKSLRVSNVDSILSNYIRRSDAQLVCLDYEWVFDFPIPIEYLIYRTVFYYYSENVHYIKISEAQLWDEFHMTEKKVCMFRQMDNHFQQYVHGENRKYIYTGNYAKKNINLGSDIKNAESWFLAVADDIQYLNCNIGRYRRDLLECRVKIHQRSVFIDKCKKRMPKSLKRFLRRVLKRA